MIIPEQIWLIRHGESLANLARHRAEAANSETIDFDGREMDVPLSDVGVGQSKAAGKWFADNKLRPTVIYSSPYTRTFESARFVAEEGGFTDVPRLVDERLRERELGIFDRLTWTGSLKRYPDECAKRQTIGKFYYRPPGGESWCDVAQRVREWWLETRLEHGPDARVLIVTHEVVVRNFRYIFEQKTESEILAIDKASDVANGAVTEYRDGLLTLDNFVP